MAIILDGIGKELRIAVRRSSSEEWPLSENFGPRPNFGTVRGRYIGALDGIPRKQGGDAVLNHRANPNQETSLAQDALYPASVTVRHVCRWDQIGSEQMRQNTGIKACRS